MFIPVLDLKVYRLVLLVIRAGPGNAGQDVKCDLAVGLWVLNLLALVGRFGGCRIRARVLERPWHTALEEQRLETGVDDAAIKSQRGVERWTHVAHLLELLPN